MSKKTFESVLYAVLAIGAFVVDFLPVSIACISILSFKWFKLFDEILDSSPEKMTNAFFLAKGIFLFLVLLGMVALVWAYLYRQGIKWH